jgi:hypothetical protein
MSELVRMIEIERERFEALAVRYSSEVQVCRHFAVLGGAYCPCPLRDERTPFICRIPTWVSILGFTVLEDRSSPSHPWLLSTTERPVARFRLTAASPP